VDRTQIEDIYEISSMQEGMLFHSVGAPGTGIYTTRVCFTLSGDLNVSAFEQAWLIATRRHPVLRTSFVWKEISKPMQIVHMNEQLTLKYYDWKAFSIPETEERLSGYIENEGRQGFCLSELPLIRLALFQCSETTHKFVVTYHHLILDGWSFNSLLREVLDYYETLSRNEKLPVLTPAAPFSDYIQWLQKQDITKLRYIGVNCSRALVRRLQSMVPELWLVYPTWKKTITSSRFNFQ
jgi:NRPS condensation-like uncharacterized protein